MMKKEYYYFVDLLRWVSAMAVIFYHYSAHFQIKNIKDSEFFNLILENSHYGAYGVWVFWIISGFVFSNIYINTKNNVGEFFLKRFARLYPLHFITLIIVALLQSYSLKEFGHWQMHLFQSNTDLFSNDIYYFIRNLFFINNGHSFNVVLWSVSVEIPVYFMFFYFVTYSKNNFFLKTIIIVFILWLNLRLNFLYYHLTMCMFYFFLGVLLYLLCTKLKKYNNFLLILSLIGILIAPFLNELKNVTFLIKFKDYIPTSILFFSSLIVFVFSLEKYFHNFGQKIKFLGDSSYGVYLIHFPIQVLILILIDHNFLSLEQLKSYKFFLFFLIITNFVSYISFKLFETPSRKKIIEYFIRKKA